jgi:hypothetical protein
VPQTRSVSGGQSIEMIQKKIFVSLCDHLSRNKEMQERAVQIDGKVIFEQHK